jgi:hypothetical protein
VTRRWSFPSPCLPLPSSPLVLTSRLVLPSRRSLPRATRRPTGTDTTPDGDDIYIGGDFNGWDPAGTLMIRSEPTDLFATVTLAFDEGAQTQYKYTRGSWDYVEKGAACEEIANRTTTVVYGTDGTMTLDDTVLNWRNTGPCGN